MLCEPTPNCCLILRCRNGADADKHVRLSQILLCLGNAARAGQALNNDCVGEIQALRKSLMEDYQATPELLADCNADSKKFCPNAKPVAGATIHCLMQHAMTPKKTERISSSCRQRVRTHNTLHINASRNIT